MINFNQAQKVGAGRTATIYRYGQNKVAKLYRQNFPEKAIDEEFQIGLTLNHLGLDIPKTYELVQLEKFLAIVFDYVPGLSMLQVLATRPWRVFSYSKQMAHLHFKIHSAQVTIDHTIPLLNESLSDKISRVNLLTADERKGIQTHLSTLKEGLSICHGDFHPDNIIVAKDRLVTVDWVTGTIGNPMADVARTWLLLMMGTLPEDKSRLEVLLAKYLRYIFCSRYIREYKRLSNFDSTEFEAWKLPVAAARLIENVSEQENQNLVKFIKRSLKNSI